MNRAVARPIGQRRQAPGGPPRQPAPPGGGGGGAEPVDIPPHADLAGSIICLIGLGTTAFFMGGVTPEDVARFAAYGALLSLGASMVMDLKNGVQNVVRTDVMALMSLYFLTLAEFLVHQGQYNAVAGMESTHTAVLACLCAYAAMVLGRHIVPLKRPQRLQALFQQPVPSPVLSGFSGRA